MPASPQAPDRSMEQIKGHVGLPIADILANISQTGANRVFVDYLQRTTPESQYLVGDAHDADCAIVACSGAWLERCGYGEDEVIGRGCRHLQGPETCARAVAAMGEAMGRDGQCATSLVNYHADGATPCPWTLSKSSPVGVRAGTKFQNDFILVPLTSRDSREARYYMSVHAAEPALDWSLAPPVPARSPEARVRSFSESLSPAAATRSPPAGLRVPV